MKISVLLRTSEYRGDHSADLTIAHELREGETVEQLVARLLPPRKEWAGERLRPSLDVIELRVVQPAEGGAP